MQVPSRADFGALSGRERQIIELAVSGLLDKNICDELEISPNTLRTYWTRIREKLGNHSRAALAAAFIADQVRAQFGEMPRNPFMQSIIVDATSRMSLATDDINERQDFPLGEHRPFSDYTGTLHPDDQAAGVAAMERLFSGEEDIVHLVFREIGPRAILTINATFFALRDDSGTVKWIYAQGMDREDISPPESSGVVHGVWVRDYPSDIMRFDEGLARIIGAPGPGYITTTQLKGHISQEEALKIELSIAEAIEQRVEKTTNDFYFETIDGTQRKAKIVRRIVYSDDGSATVYGDMYVFE